VLVLAACGSHNDFFASAEREELVKRWQGIWVLPYTSSAPGSDPGTDNDMFEVSGTKLTYWTGDVGAQGELALVAPCLARLHTGETFTYRPFAFGQQLHVDNAVGVRRGERFVACLGEGVVVTGDEHDDKCRAFGTRLRRAEDDGGVDAKCRVGKDGLHITLPEHQREYAMMIDDGVWVPNREEYHPEIAYHATSPDDARSHR